MSKLERLWKNKDGQIVVFQLPNLPLLVWIISYGLTKILPYGQLNFAASLISFGALFTWAWLEIFDGDTGLRRLLGLVVMIALIMNRLS